MSIYSSSRNPVGNRLLAALPQEEYERLLPKLEPVTLSLRQILYEPGEPIKYVYFPNNAVGSLLNQMQDGQTIEAATVGKEGMIGVPLLLGTNQIGLQALITDSREWFTNEGRCVPNRGLLGLSVAYAAATLYASADEPNLPNGGL